MQNHNNGVFVISLDAVDLNLLPTIYNEKPDKVSPLWSRSNLQMRNNDYYQFEIKCKDCEGSKEDKPPKHEYKNKICHICDIEVPIPFLSEHRKSVRHKANVKIADIAIQRMKKYLNETEHDIDNDLQSSAQFCPTCVMVIDSEDRITHEKSPSHRNAYIVEKFLNDFLILYNVSDTNDMTNEINNINEVENDIASNIVNKKTEKIYTDATVNKVESDIANSIVNKKTKNIYADVTVNTNPIDKDTANIDVFKLNAYIDLLNKSNNIPMYFKVVNENLIEIEAVDGSIVRVADKNFYGFNRISRKHMQCLLCKLNFKEKKADAHMMSSKHIMNVIVRLNDKHCLRYIDDDYYHCIICNIITENSDLHLLCNKNHEKLLKIALISDKLDETTNQSQIHEDYPILEKVNDNQSANENQQSANDNEQSANKNIISYADMLQTYKKPIPQNNTMDSSSKEVYDQTVTNENAFKETVLLNEGSAPDPSEPLADKLGHIEKVNKLPENRIFCEICNKLISKKHITRHQLRSQHILNSISDPLYLMSEIDSIYLLCKICHIRIIKNLDNVRKHILDEDHKLKYKNKLMYNSISRIDQSILYCKLCDEIIVNGKEIIHIETKQHRFKCDTTENVLDDEKNNDNEQENDASDEENYENKQTNHETEASNTFEFYQCTVCDVKVPNYTNNIQEHLNGRVHLKNLEKYSVDSNNKTQDSVDNYHYHMELSEFPSCLNCIVCNINIIYKEDAVMQHLNDLTHTKNYETLLENNILVKHTDNIYCNLCKVAVGAKGELLHIKGRKHKKNIEKHNQTVNHAASVINEIENRNINIQTENDPSETLIRVASARNIEPEMIIFLKEIDANSVECVVCKVQIPFTEYNVRTHMNGNRHAKNINSESTSDETK